MVISRRWLSWTIFNFCVNACWFCFRGTVALVIIALVVGGGYLYFNLDDETHRIAERALQEHCRPFHATIGSARYVSGKGVTVYDLHLTESYANGQVESVLHIDELKLEGRFDVATLVRSHPEVERVIIRRPRLLAKRYQDGTWNLSKLVPPSHAKTGKSPQVFIEKGTLILDDQKNATSQPITLQDLDIGLGPSARQSGWYDFSLVSSNFFAKKIDLKGSVNPASSGFQITAHVDSAILNHQIIDALPIPAIEQQLPAMRGLVSFSGTAGRASLAEPIRWNTEFNLSNGEFHLPQLQRPLTKLALSGSCSNEQLRVSNATAVWGNAQIQAVLHRNGWSKDAPLATRCRVTNCDIKNLPIGLGPNSAQELWNRFQPDGIADISVEASFDGQKWVPRATIDARATSFTDLEKFPYRVSNASGRIDLFGGVNLSQPSQETVEDTRPLSADLTAFVEGTPVRIVVAFDELDSPVIDGKKRMPPGLVEVSGVGIPITESLVNALPDPSTQRTIRSMRPGGKVDLRWRVERLSNQELELKTALDVRLAGCSINYTNFPYALQNVTGWVRERNRNWTFTELESRDVHGNLFVNGSGSLVPANGGYRFTLQLSGNRMTLDDRLYRALPSDSQAVWDFVRPRGNLDFRTTITTEPGANKPQVQLSMIPHGQSLTIEPPLSDTGHRYRFEQVAGRFDWINNQLTIRGARGKHGRTLYSTNGIWQLQPGGSWQLDLSDLNADRLAINHDLLLACPTSLRSVLESLQPTGGIDLANSRLRVNQPMDKGTTARVDWDITIACHQASINTGVPLSGISGLVRLIGASNETAAYTGGEFDLDSVVWNDLQMTQVKGPMWANTDKCLLGEGASRQLGAQPRAVNAIAYDGNLAINSQVLFGGRPRYGLAVDLTEVDVSRLATEWFQRPEALQGSLGGRLEFQGVGTSIYGLEGKGNLAINEANLYELPVLVRLLKVLRNKTPDQTAFDRLEANFTMRGEQILFQDLDLLGDAVSLYGQGDATLDRNLNLTFHSLVGRTDNAIPGFRNLLGQASEQLLQMRVVGTVDQPEIRREMLPGVGNMLGQLQSGPTPGSPTYQPRTSYNSRMRNQTFTPPPK